jgi:Tfp pilus assembly protein PilV
MKKNLVRKKNEAVGFSGFTLVETMVTLVLVLMGVVLISKTLIFGLDSLKRSRLRLQLQESIQSQCQALMSRPYDSSDLAPGPKTKPEPPFRIHWDVSEISPGLKRVSVSAGNGRLTVRTYFYKSKYIKDIRAGSGYTGEA